MASPTAGEASHGEPFFPATGTRRWRNGGKVLAAGIRHVCVHTAVDADRTWCDAREQNVLIDWQVVLVADKLPMHSGRASTENG